MVWFCLGIRSNYTLSCSQLSRKGSLHPYCTFRICKKDREIERDDKGRQVNRRHAPMHRTPHRQRERAVEGQWPVAAPAGDTECIMHLIGALQLRAERQASSLFTSLQSICPLSVLIGAKAKKTQAESPSLPLETSFSVSKDNNIQFSLLAWLKKERNTRAKKRDKQHKGNSCQINNLLQCRRKYN